ncbi:MAG: HD domain-containing protein [Anaerolineae bacterium]|nr:HD domain-containing protein [Anaerolineae bacterium]
MLTKQQFLLREKSASRTRQGTLMLRVTLADRTGSIPGVFFDVPGHVLDALEVGRGVEVSGRVDEYRGQIQVNIDRIAPAELSQLDEFLPTARRPHETLTREFEALRASIADPELVSLLTAVFDEETYARFVRAPAAKYNHHACVGGLLEHTLDVARLVQTACDLYPELHRDLAITATILHDLGKISAYDPVSFDLTEAGELWSHLYIGAAMVERAIDAMGGLSEPLKMQLLHAILAHHGKLEHGSPVVPMTLEAITLSNADRFDADVRGAVDHLERTEEDGSAFTGRSYMHETKLYRGPMEEEPPSQRTLI